MFTTAGLTLSVRSENDPGVVPSSADAAGISGAPEGARDDLNTSTKRNNKKGNQKRHQKHEKRFTVLIFHINVINLRYYWSNIIVDDRFTRYIKFILFKQYNCKDVFVNKILFNMGQQETSFQTFWV